MALDGIAIPLAGSHFNNSLADIVEESYEFHAKFTALDLNGKDASSRTIFHVELESVELFRHLLPLDDREADVSNVITPGCDSRYVDEVGRLGIRSVSLALPSTGDACLY